MSLLTLFTSVAPRLSLPTPSAVVTSTDQNLVTLLALANEEGQELAERHRWTALIREATHTTIAAQNQGVMATIAGADWNENYKILEGTFWDRSGDQPVLPITPEEWQRYQANSITGPYFKYRIQTGNLYMIPTPSAGKSLAFEYVSKNWCQSNAAARQSAWAADTDTGILSERLMALGLIWRWKELKGFKYDEDFRKYEQKVENAIARDQANPTISMNARAGTRFIGGSSVSEGSWSL